MATACAVYAVEPTFAQPPGRPASARPAHASRPTASATAVTSTVLNKPQFAIPFSVDTLGTQPVEVQLFVSRDAGGQWEFIGRQPAGSREFPFQAAADGDYWFATRTIDAAGAAHPAGPVSPQLRVTVDTTNPQLEAQADADSNGQIIVDYRVLDASPRRDGIELQYMTDTVRQWMPVEAAAPAVQGEQDNTLEGRIAWVPQSEWRHVYIRIIVRDRAGNQTVLTRQVEKPRVAQQPFQLASQPPAQAPADRPPGNWPANDAWPDQYAPDGYAGVEARPAPAAAPPSSTPPPAAHYAPDRYASNQLRGLDLSDPRGSQVEGTGPNSRGTPAEAAAPNRDDGRVPPSSSPPATMPEARRRTPERTRDPARHPAPAETPPAAAPRRTIENAVRPLPIEQVPAPQPQTSRQPQASRPAESAGEPAAEQRTDVPRQTSSRPARSAVPARPASMRERVDALPPGSLVRRSDTRTFSLDYEIDAVGSQGTDAIELWCTKDGGATWKYWDKDPDKQSPFDIMTSNDGLYGFRMVVVGGNGLTSPRPMPGDNADIYVLIDTVAPQPRITGARYGEGEQTGQLVIEYECHDETESLASRPIGLAFADSLDGPWTTIATGLANDGQYLWPADPQLPRQIYLRIEATDQAGNVGVDTLETPIDVQGLAPRARIRGFQPVKETATRPRGRIR